MSHKSFEIRPTVPEDIPEIVKIYDKARAFMRRSGNLHQWSDNYPNVESLLRDIAQGCSYVCVDEGLIVGTFFFMIGKDPTYTVIEGGEWLNDGRYGVIHRVASDGSVKGLMHKILDFCATQIDNIRIDTHRDNTVMRNALLRYGFKYCGIIHIANGDERRAYQYICQPRPKPTTLCRRLKLLLSAVAIALSAAAQNAELHGVGETYSLIELPTDTLPSLNTPRTGHTTLCLDGELTVFGGHTDGFIPTATAEYFRDGAWLTVPLVYPHDNATALGLRSGKVFLAGGHLVSNFAPSSTVIRLPLGVGSDSVASLSTSDSSSRGWLPWVIVIVIINTTYVSAAINSQTGCSFTQFLTKYRITYAQELMRQNPESKISLISTQSGFSTDSTFFRAFRSSTGKSPKEWLSTISDER